MEVLARLWGATSTQEEDDLEFATEFHRLREEFPTDVGDLVRQYPLASLVLVVAGAFFGFMNIFHFTISALVTSAIILALALGVGRAVSKTEGGYWANVWVSIVQVKNYLFIEKDKKQGNAAHAA